MKRILIRVAYDGTSYHGWQLQAGRITVESELNRALTELLGEKIQVIGASRTDAGVHSVDSVAVFDTMSRMPADRVSYAVNQRLPADIRVTASEEVENDFHPRKIQSRKTYEYHIWHAEFDNPVRSRYTHHVYTPLDIEAMSEAALYFIGEHDFKAFCAAGSQAQTTVRNIYGAQVHEQEHEIVISICGSSFLYNMVRIIAGTLIQAGQGKLKPSDIPAIIESRDRSKSGPTAPAKGLILRKFEFD